MKYSQSIQNSRVHVQGRLELVKPFNPMAGAVWQVVHVQRWHGVLSCGDAQSKDGVGFFLDTLGVCYTRRKHGHNEIDEPMFTQPLMYRQIKQHKSAHQQYIEKLIAEGSLSKEEIKSIHDKIQSMLNAEFDGAKEYKPQAKDWLASHWSGFKSPAQLSRIRNTGVKGDILRSVGNAITALPPTFTPHRQIRKVYEARRAMVEAGESHSTEQPRKLVSSKTGPTVYSIVVHAHCVLL